MISYVPQNPEASTHPTSGYIVRWRQFAIRFGHNAVLGAVYSCVADKDATVFADEAQAHSTAQRHNLLASGYSVESLLTAQCTGPATPVAVAVR